MHRIDTPSATVDNLFTDGSPAGGVPATVVPADYLNDLQENLCAVIEAAGITLTKGRSEDLLDAIQQLFAATYASSAEVQSGLEPSKSVSPATLLSGLLGAGGLSGSDYITIPFRDKSSGIRRNLILQWGGVTATIAGTPLTWPIAFPNAVLRCIPGIVNGSAPRDLSFAVPSLTGSTAYTTASAPGSTAYYLVLGF